MLEDQECSVVRVLTFFCFASLLLACSRKAGSVGSVTDVRDIGFTCSMRISPADGGSFRTLGKIKIEIESNLPFKVESLGTVPARSASLIEESLVMSVNRATAQAFINHDGPKELNLTIRESGGQSLATCSAKIQTNDTRTLCRWVDMVGQNVLDYTFRESGPSGLTTEWAPQGAQFALYRQPSDDCDVPLYSCLLGNDANDHFIGVSCPSGSAYEFPAPIGYGCSAPSPGLVPLNMSWRSFLLNGVPEYVHLNTTDPGQLGNAGSWNGPVFQAYVPPAQPGAICDRR